MQKFTILTAILLSLVLSVNGQYDTLYIMKGGSVINKQSITQRDIDSIFFYNLDTMAFIKNNLIINKQSIKSSDVDSVIFYQPTTRPTVTDFDGNVYNTVIIGTQDWMAENLKTTHYSDGTAIPLVNKLTAWDTLKATDKAYCWYEDDIANKVTYGALYTWGAAMNGKASSTSDPSRVQGVCPIGWHLPSDEEWLALENFLIANKYNWDGSTEEDKIGKSLAAKNDWNTASSAESVGNDLHSNNSTGFTALPGGSRDDYGGFQGIGYSGYWWSTTENSATKAYYQRLFYGYADLTKLSFGKGYGFSVRCVRD